MIHSRSIGTGRVAVGGLSLRPHPFVSEDPEPEKNYSQNDDEDKHAIIHVGADSGADIAGGRGSDAVSSHAQSIVGYEEPIVLTQSTHSFLFTEPTCSVPFAFAVAIVGISYTCLCLALINNIGKSSRGNRLNIPVGVTLDVRIAQYFALLIGLIMEEEIPESLYLLRMITERTLRDGAPALSFRKFVFCACARVVMGYLFYLNMFVVVAQATAVIDIFYDVLALQFLQQVDDIAFGLARKDVFGKGMKRASTRKCFRAEFEKLPFARRKRRTFFVKALYVFNLLLLVAGMTFVVVKQDRGDYQCSSITVNFDDHIWENAIVFNSTGAVEEMDLIYSYFSGVYVLNETIGLRDERPVYSEQNKFDNTPYGEKTGAMIRYCKSEGAWVFAHENIRKDRNARNTDCPWLLRSPDTKDFDLLEVSSDWSVWTGVIDTATIKASCNGCDSETECNYHGTCNDEPSDGQCTCDPSADDGYPLYTGVHCEFPRPCLRIRGGGGGIFNLVPVGQNEDGISIWNSYGRGVYLYDSGGNVTIVEDTDNLLLAFAGSRWFGSYYREGKQRSRDHWVRYSREFHAFWDRVYKENTLYVSDPASRPGPIAVDFFEIGRRGAKYGPLGELIPLADHPGSGHFECIDSNLTIDEFVSEILEQRGDLISD